MAANNPYFIIYYYAITCTCINTDEAMYVNIQFRINDVIIIYNCRVWLIWLINVFKVKQIYIICFYSSLSTCVYINCVRGSRFSGEEFMFSLAHFLYEFITKKICKHVICSTQDNCSTSYWSKFHLTFPIPNKNWNRKKEYSWNISCFVLACQHHVWILL